MEEVRSGPLSSHLSSLAARPPAAVFSDEQLENGEVTAVRESIGSLRVNLGRVFLGKPEVVDLALTALLADGHLLIEDVPGLGKTLLAKALARCLACTFHRIQLTPDMLPSDVLGTSIYHQASGTFVFQPGPLFAHVVLADEINRATPRTQSALLEAMSERQISIDGQTRLLDPPFLVLATQNPFEFEGTYPLPESQLDRFLMRLRIGYPDREVEKRILSGHRQGEPVDHLEPVLAAAQVVQLQQATRRIKMAEPVVEYLLDLIRGTRNHPDLALGASTRAALGLYRAVQARALLEGRTFAVPDDVKGLAVPVLSHRLLARAVSHGPGAPITEQVVASILQQISVPV